MRVTNGFRKTARSGIKGPEIGLRVRPTLAEKITRSRPAKRLGCRRHLIIYPGRSGLSELWHWWKRGNSTPVRSSLPNFPPALYQGLAPAPEYRYSAFQRLTSKFRAKHGSFLNRFGQGRAFVALPAPKIAMNCRTADRNCENSSTCVSSACQLHSDFGL